MAWGSRFSRPRSSPVNSPWGLITMHLKRLRELLCPGLRSDGSSASTGDEGSGLLASCEKCGRGSPPTETRAQDSPRCGDFRVSQPFVRCTGERTPRTVGDFPETEVG